MIRSKKDKKNMEDAVIGETNASLAQKLDTGNRTLKKLRQQKEELDAINKKFEKPTASTKTKKDKDEELEALKVAKAKAETADDMLTSKTRSRPCVRGVN
ncbi:MAG: hypothetical protein IPI29_08540 [Ignavibacteria bacterium]|nr:hypothetical protein [Ignavibacteria bacterium]